MTLSGVPMSTASQRPRSSARNSSEAGAQAFSPLLCLEVCRGTTQFPRRPFPAGRFLIGAGAECDMRLGGSEMPALHSILQVDARGMTIEAVAQAPQLKLNGKVTQGARLRVGDE